MTTNAILLPGQESQTYGMRDGFERVQPDRRAVRARAVRRTSSRVALSDV